MDEALRYRPRNRLLIIVGNFGSGKTEVAVNLALDLARSQSVCIADLDLVNPYFRCREAQEEMEALGIRVVYPKGEYRAADLPILLPEVRGAVGDPERLAILDVGGDDAGARVLSALADTIVAREHDLLMVVNANRPFTADVPGCARMKEAIESSSRLRVTGVISNTHLMEETDAGTVRAGITLARSFAASEGIRFECAVADRGRAEELAAEGERGPFLVIERKMLPPWLTRGATAGSGWFRRGA
ncbi:MAG: cobalamin biosynthesis protein CbiA [Planctomycetes bacterium]|jgi:hypothetical protein|nr:cobalamin biosynthesis protein CbiA [Planctomycetota bacterium]